MGAVQGEGGPGWRPDVRLTDERRGELQKLLAELIDPKGLPIGLSQTRRTLLAVLRALLETDADRVSNR
jgi:hypothetical protein